jgi:hypothetical protein
MVHQPRSDSGILKHQMVQTERYMDRFAKAYGLDPGDERLNRQAETRGEFESSVLRAAHEDLARQNEELSAKLQLHQADIVKLVRAELAKQQAETGKPLDPGGAASAGTIKDWRTASPEAVARKKAEVRSKL